MPTILTRTLASHLSQPFRQTSPPCACFSLLGLMLSAVNLSHVSSVTTRL